MSHFTMQLLQRLVWVIIWILSAKEKYGGGGCFAFEISSEVTALVKVLSKLGSIIKIMSSTFYKLLHIS